MWNSNDQIHPTHLSDQMDPSVQDSRKEIYQKRAMQTLGQYPIFFYLKIKLERNALGGKYVLNVQLKGCGDRHHKGKSPLPEATHPGGQRSSEVQQLLL